MWWNCAFVPDVSHCVTPLYRTGQTLIYCHVIKVSVDDVTWMTQWRNMKSRWWVSSKVNECVTHIIHRDCLLGHQLSCRSFNVCQHALTCFPTCMFQTDDLGRCIHNVRWTNNIWLVDATFCRNSIDKWINKYILQTCFGKIPSSFDGK